VADELGTLFEGVEKLRQDSVRQKRRSHCEGAERGKELLFIELNFGAKARDEFKALMTAYYDSYGIVSAQRAEYVCSKTKALLTTIYATIGERFELE
jgi:hypothetical protein